MLAQMAKSGSSMVLILALAMAVSACGRRGNLEPPPSELSGFEDDSGEPEVVKPKPDRPFILDPLL